MKLAYKTLLVVGLLLVVESALACFVAKRGFNWTADELISQSDSIILAVLAEKELGPDGESRSRLKTIEVLKGDAPDLVEFFTYSDEHHSWHFNSHTDDRFWLEDIGRSAYPCCICGPDHTFVEGETYLLFPDAFGAMKSAEIIPSPEDRWLKYVRDSLQRTDKESQVLSEK